MKGDDVLCCICGLYIGWGAVGEEVVNQCGNGMKVGKLVLVSMCCMCGVVSDKVDGVGEGARSCALFLFTECCE